MAICEERLARAKQIDFVVKPSTIQITGSHSPQKAAAGPATAASRRRARSQAEVRILCILDTECRGCRGRGLCLQADQPTQTQQPGWLGAILALIPRPRQCPSCQTHIYLVDTYRPTLLSVTDGGYVGWRLEIEDLIISPFLLC